MATVHIGRLLGPVGFSRTVAIKRLHPRYAGDPEFVSMFLEEARLVARIRHPHVVPMLDVVATSGELFLVMEYVAGDSLARLAQATAERRARVPLRVSVAILSGLLQGLHAAHEARDERGQPLGIVHRDVSPQNVLVGCDGQARVLDFGIAKAAGRVQTAADGQVQGKLAYTAPEQLRGGEVTRKVDIYAASVVLWELLVGHPLFQGDNEGATLTKVLLDEVVPPSVAVKNRGVPIDPETMHALERLDEVTLRGLHRDQAERFETAKEMALALEACAPPATASEVSAWVEQVASSTLWRRAKDVTAIEAGNLTDSQTTLESTPRSSSGPAKKSASRVAPRGGGRWRTVAVGVAGVGFAVVAVASVLDARTSVVRAARAPEASSLQPVLVPSAPVSAVSTASTEDSPALASAMPVSVVAPPRTTAGAKHAKPAGRPTPARGCDPPYTWDDEGRKHYKSECL
jgi:serine/threonine-protein kinase